MVLPNQLFIKNIMIINRGDFLKLIVGLGNPGKEYENTRHNIGFYVVDNYLNSKNLNVNWSKKFNGLYYQTNLYGEKVIFLKPQSYMNLSGGVVRKYIDYFKINIDDVLIISDDLDLNVGNFKLREKGSSGGHNGLKDIESNLGTNIYKRLKIGISNDNSIDTKDYVLGKFSVKEKEIYNELNSALFNVLDDYFVGSFSDLMCKYNKKNR